MALWYMLKSYFHSTHRLSAFLAQWPCNSCLHLHARSWSDCLRFSYQNCASVYFAPLAFGLTKTSAERFVQPIVNFYFRSTDKSLKGWKFTHPGAYSLTRYNFVSIRRAVCRTTLKLSALIFLVLWTVFPFLRRWIRCEIPKLNFGFVEKDYHN